MYLDQLEEKIKTPLVSMYKHRVTARMTVKRIH